MEINRNIICEYLRTITPDVTTIYDEITYIRVIKNTIYFRLRYSIKGDKYYDIHSLDMETYINYIISLRKKKIEKIKNVIK